MKKLWKRNMVAGAVLLLVCGAIFLNGRYAQQVEETDKILGQATLVDGTEGDAEEVSGEALPGDYFATARLFCRRQAARRRSMRRQQPRLRRASRRSQPTRSPKRRSKT